MRTFNRFLFWFVLFLVLSHFSKKAMDEFPQEKRLSFPDFITEVKSGKIQDVTFDGSSITGNFKKKDEQGRTISFKTVGHTGDSTLKILSDNGITPHYREELIFPLYEIFLKSVFFWIPIVLPVVILFLIIRIDKKIKNIGGDPGIVEMDNDNLLKDPEEKHDEYHAYKIWLTSPERKLVRDALVETKNTHGSQMESNRSGEHIAHICKIFLEKK